MAGLCYYPLRAHIPKPLWLRNSFSRASLLFSNNPAIISGLRYYGTVVSAYDFFKFVVRGRSPAFIGSSPMVWRRFGSVLYFSSAFI